MKGDKMSNIQILDCTLRDGGYCNQWNFGKDNICQITNALIDSKVEIIECGFLTEKKIYNNNYSKYNSIVEINETFPQYRYDSLFVCMINYGEYSLEKIPDRKMVGLDGIRVAFHKDDLDPAINYCKEIIKKGYKVFVQAMVSLNYSDKEFLELLSKVNDISPYAFYIVDSFGVMRRKELIRLFYLVENNLNKDIIIGYHCHNNMQLAYSNAQCLTEINTNRNIIIDSSIYGMGRGAGNLNTELFLEYLNNSFGKNYILKPILITIDEIINDFYQDKGWGYSLANYLSAKHNTHPSYASYLDSKKTLTYEAMDDIFNLMDLSKRNHFDKSYIETLYIEYMEKGFLESNNLLELKKRIAHREVLVVAPGLTSRKEIEIIKKTYTEKKPIVIAINFEYTEVETNYIFVSNLRRFKSINSLSYKKCIVTSNISCDDVFLKVSYKKLLNQYDLVKDNAGLMLIKFLIDLDVKRIYIAGLDGYSPDYSQNYAYDNMTIFNKANNIEKKNQGLTQVLLNYARLVEIKFITTHERIGF